MPLDLFTTTETRWLEVEIDQVKRKRQSNRIYARGLSGDELGG
jgi:hypothetical protein